MFGAMVFVQSACISQCLSNYLRVLGISVLIAGAWPTYIFGINFNDGMSLIFLLLKIRRHSRCLPRARPPPLRVTVLLFDFLLIVGEHDIDGIPIILGSVSDFINGPMMSKRGLPRSRSLRAPTYRFNAIWVMDGQGNRLDDRGDWRLGLCSSLSVHSGETLPHWSCERGLAWVEIQITSRSIEVRRLLSGLVSNDDI